MTPLPRRLAPLPMLILLQLPLGALVPGIGVTAQIARELIFWLLSILLLFHVRVLERRPLSSIGLAAPTKQSLVWGLACGSTIIAGGIVLFEVILPALGLAEDPDAVQMIDDLPAWLRVFMVLRAPWFEELVYRGFAIERLTEMAGLRWLAAILSLACFTYAHLDYWGWVHLIFVGFAALLLTGLYLWRRDLAACMIAHLVTDGVGMLVG